MPDIIAHGKLKRVIYARFKPQEDLYLGIMELVRREKIKTGVVLSITGGLSKTRLSLPLRQESVQSAPGLIEVEGLGEASGHGLIGQNLDTWGSPASGIYYNKGEPHLHIHLTVTVAGKTYCGHLIEGCIVRSLIPQSHFTIVLAEVEGPTLSYRVEPTITKAYPNGIPYYELSEERM